MKPGGLSQTGRSPLQLFIVIIGSVFMAEVLAMIVVYLIQPAHYFVLTLIDAGIMTLLICPVVYYFSFRPLIQQIEKSKAAEESLLKSSELQEKFFDSIDTLIAYMDRDFNFIRVNDSYAREGGYPTEYFTGKNHFVLYPHAENQEIFRRVVETGLPYIVQERAFEYPDDPGRGVTYWNWGLQPVRGSDGMVEGLVLSLVDVTERKRAEERLRTAYDDLELRVQERTESLRLANISLETEIAERKRVEEVLRYQAALLSNVNDAIIAADAQFRITAWNAAAESLYGWKAENVIGCNGLELVRTEWTEKNPDEMRRAIAQTGHWRGEVTQIRKDGTRFPVEISSMVLFDDTGQITGYVSANRDITERKQVEEELRLVRDELELRVQERTAELAKEITERKEIERQLRIQATAMESAANGIVITDRNGSIQWVNPALVQISGYDSVDLIGQNMHIFSSGQQDESFYHPMWTAILSGEVWQGQLTNRRKDGRLYIEEQTIAPVWNERDEITHFIAIKQDITERKQGEEALRQSEEKFRTLVEWTYDWEMWVDPHGRIVYNSPSCERITGYSLEEFISDHDLILHMIHLDDQALYENHQRIIHDESAGVEKIEYRIITCDQQERWIEHTCRPLFGADNRYLGRRVGNRDITERKQAEQVIKERSQKEKLLLQTIHTMQLDIARDLHDTLGQNIGFLRMKLDYLAEKKIRKQAEMQLELRNMARAANESYDLMRGTLAVLQSENSTDLFRLFARYAKQIEERSSFTIKLLNQGEPRYMSAKRMRQLFYIFREILNNIEKHANATEVSLEMTWEQDGLQLFVFDNGSGFDPDKTQYGGHYGLKFMKDRVELLNGSLSLESTVGSGTNIKLQVPYE